MKSKSIQDTTLEEFIFEKFPGLVALRAVSPDIIKATTALVVSPEPPICLDRSGAVIVKASEGISGRDIFSALFGYHKLLGYEVTVLEGNDTGVLKGIHLLSALRPPESGDTTMEVINVWVSDQSTKKEKGIFSICYFTRMFEREPE